MKSVVVVGAQWGDEGKGKVVDYLSGSFDYIARVAGGHNAGHTVIIGKDRFVLQLIPCGILRPRRHAVIGTGVVVDPAALVAEMETLANAGVDVNGQNRHNLARHWPGLRRQDGSPRAARLRLAGARTVSQESRTGGDGKEPASKGRLRSRH
jgi:hypothetical protein